jgi:hypothetical protein
MSTILAQRDRSCETPVMERGQPDSRPISQPDSRPDSDGTQEPTAQLALREGSYDAMVVDAEWVEHDEGVEALRLSVTVTSGELKGSLVDVRFAAGTPGLDSALRSCGVTGHAVVGDPSVCSAVLAMPCTMVVVADPQRGPGIAISPP